MNRVYLDPNTKYSDQYAMLAKLPDIVDEINEVADKAEQVPDPAVGDIGKVLGIVSDGESGAKIDAVEPSGGLPDIGSGDAGKVLTVNESHTAAEWADVPTELPAIGDSDAGKVLTVNQSHTAAEWATPSGGTSYYESAGATDVVNTEITWQDQGHLEFQGNVTIKTIPLASEFPTLPVIVVNADLPIYVNNNLIGTFKAGSYPNDFGNVEYPDGWNNEYGIYLTYDSDSTNYYMLVGIDDSTGAFSHSSDVMTAISVGLVKPTDLFVTFVRALNS